MRCMTSLMTPVHRATPITKPRCTCRPTSPRLVLLVWAVAAACHTANPAPSFRVQNRFWLESGREQAALTLATQRVRASVAQALSDGVLETGFPRDCTVTEPEAPTVPFDPECLEGGAMPDGLLLDSTGTFLQFVAIDFLSSRLFLFEVYLVPDGATAAILTPEALAEYPHVAIPHFELAEATYQQWLAAVERGIQASGAKPF
jgi:hypothetical protein